MTTGSNSPLIDDFHCAHEPVEIFGGAFDEPALLDAVVKTESVPVASSTG